MMQPHHFVRKLICLRARTHTQTVVVYMRAAMAPPAFLRRGCGISIAPLLPPLYSSSSSDDEDDEDDESSEDSDCDHSYVSPSVRQRARCPAASARRSHASFSSPTPSDDNDADGGAARLQRTC